MKQYYSFERYKPSLSSKELAMRIHNEIFCLNPTVNEVEVDLSGIIAMTTICARLIFGKLFIEIGKDNFQKNIIIKGANESLRIVIRWGIAKELENNP